MLNFKQTKVAVVGLSTEGQDSVRFFAAEGADITCCDRRSREELGDLYDQLTPLNVRFQLGEEYLHNLEAFDVVIRTPGMSLDTPEFAHCIAKGLLVTSNTKLFMELCPAPIVGVTGTKGKGTTSTLVHNMIQKSGKEVYLGGNVGMPLLSKVRSMAPGALVVLEMSSFQLEDCDKSPRVAVVLRITEDHLANHDPLAGNFHKDRKTYVQAKSAIVRYQKKDDFVICNADDPTSMSFADLTPARRYTFGRGRVPADARIEGENVVVDWQGKKETVVTAKDIQVPGKHNWENIAAATLAALAVDISLEAIREAVREFKGLPHRIEFVRSVRGVSYYDDSFSTVPDTTIAAIDAFEQPEVLIVGGSEKGADFSALGRHIAQSRVHTTIVIGDMTQRIVTSLEKANYKGTTVTGKKTMHEIVDAARIAAKSGDVVLLSPSCASFDMFKNYKDRGNQFKHEVSLL